MKKNIVILRRKALGKGSTNGIKKASKFKNDITIVRSDNITVKNTDLLIRWGTTASGVIGTKTLNKAAKISINSNKGLIRTLLSQNNVSVPKIFNIKELDSITYPVIVRPQMHSQGKHLYTANNSTELLNVPQNVLYDGYISEFIPKDAEYGVFIFQGRITNVIQKVPKTTDANKSVAWNIAGGTHKFVNVRWADWPILVCVEALKANNVIGLDFCRVDVMLKGDKPYILELNSAHSLESDYRKKCFAKALDWFIEDKEVKPVNFKYIKTFKALIHPAIRNKNGTKKA
jgi:glutathione synthase/RimK-type ligase-like ATP-grasp enzyme